MYGVRNAVDSVIDIPVNLRKIGILKRSMSTQEGHYKCPVKNTCLCIRVDHTPRV